MDNQYPIGSSLLDSPAYTGGISGGPQIVNTNQALVQQLDQDLK